MAARGYCTYADVATELGGITLTTPQQTAANSRIESAELWLDRYLGRRWLIASPVTAETHLVYGDRVWLQQRPVVDVTAVTVRLPIVGDTATTTTELTDFELLDAANGVLLVGVRDGAWVSVAYTHTSTVPADVALAAAKLAAHWMGPVLEGGLASLKSQVKQIAVGSGDLSLTFQDHAATQGVPPEIKGLLAGYRRLVFV